ncbi:uncharacterized protein [Drosophila bipectinata]|uniref:uncharacterized protein n=1 Tax=Drosophila bipectinata TaxID=42026 RepID=UPI0038B4028C
MLYEQSIVDLKKLQKLDQFLTFLEHRFLTLEATGSDKINHTKKGTCAQIDQPGQSIDINRWKLPKHIELADPNFDKTGRIDLLLGAEHYYDIMQDKHLSLALTEEDKVDEQITKFWELDSFSTDAPCLSPLEKQCERHFLQHIQTAIDKKSIVRLPFMDNASALGESRDLATRRFLSLEKRLLRDPQTKASYVEFMKEYEALGHMEEMHTSEIKKARYFIPHHCVLKPESTTTKLRVVFDASAVTSSGKSLNDLLHKGPTVQNSIFSILLRFRTYKYVFTADIEKMYRQIWINPEDQYFQTIVWRNNPSEDLRYYRLKTVTYGTKAAPYLATKCLQHIAQKGRKEYPNGAAALENDFYVDDCLTGAETIPEALQRQQQLNKLLQNSGFKLRKWCTNNFQVLQGVPREDITSNVQLEETSYEDYTIKTLGITWTPTTDHLCGKTEIATKANISRRDVVSEIFRIFDPLGLFSPVVMKAKIFMQHLTKKGYEYKDDLPAHLQEEWKRYREELKVLNTIKVPRHVYLGKTPVTAEIHTFVDASEKAYGAAWRHVASEHNAADVLSRGMTASKFAEHATWFYGPMFLHGSSSTWPAPFIATNEELIIMNPPKVSQSSVMTITKEEDIIYTIQHNNSFNKLLRIIAYIMRFRRKKKYTSHTIEFEEIMAARKIVFRNIQKIDFKDDIKHLKRQRETLKGSSINSLSPFLDQNGILRVGGRLEAANISFDSKHPILLPYNDPVVKMILVQIHKDNMHCGPQALLTASRQQFWILKGKTMARSTVRACVKCTKAKPKLMEQIMGNLPPLRNEIIKVLTDVRHNTISPLLSSPRQLKEQCDQIRDHLKPGQMLPVNQENILMAYKMMQAEDIWLRNTGLLTARAGCTIRNSLITVISQTGIETSTLISYARFGEIDGNNTTIKRQNTTSSKTNKFGYTKLLDLQRDLVPNRRLRLPHRLETIKHHHIAMYIGLTFIIIILTIHWVRKWYKGDKRPQQVQVPAVAMRKTDTTSSPPFTINIDDC